MSCLNCFSEVSVSLSLLKDKLKTTLDEVNYYFNCVTVIHLIIDLVTRREKKKSFFKYTRFSASPTFKVVLNAVLQSF